MKTRSAIIAAIMALGALGGLAQTPAPSAEAPKAPPKDAFGGPGGYFKYNPVLAALDADGDKVISAEEWAKLPAVLRTFDKDGNGVLTGDEVKPNIPEPEPPPGQKPDTMADRLMAFDKNHDGKLAKAEMPARMMPLFDRGDTNHDGFLTKAEIDKLEAALEPPKGDVKREYEGQRQGGFLRQDPFLISIDTDHNGEISTEEMDASTTSSKRLDFNKDGMLTENELRPRPAVRSMDETVVLIFNNNDKNHDGKVTADEYPPNLKSMFGRADIDHDGAVTLDELKALVKREGGLYGDRAPAAPSVPAKK